MALSHFCSHRHFRGWEAQSQVSWPAQDRRVPTERSWTLLPHSGSHRKQNLWASFFWNHRNGRGVGTAEAEGMKQDNCTYRPLATHPTPPFLSVCHGKYFGPGILATSPPRYRPGPGITHRPPGRPCPPLALLGGLPPAVPVTAGHCPFWSGVQPLQKPGAGHGSVTGGCSSQPRGGVETKVGVHRALTFQPYLAVPDRTLSRGPPEGPGPAGTF